MPSVFTKRTKKLRVAKLLTGTVSVAAGTNALVGSGTLFTTELAANDYVWINGELLQVASITDNNNAVLSAVHAAAIAAGSSITRTTSPLYTSPAATLSILHSLFVSNINKIDYLSFTMRIFDNTTDEWIVVATGLEIPTGNTYSHPKPIDVEAGDIFHLEIDAGNDGDMHVYCSIVQKT